MAKSVLDILIKLSKQGGADKETVTGLVKVKSALMDAAAVAGTFVAAGYSIKAVLDQTLGAQVKYAAQVRDVAVATGLQAEGASRLIQMTDDLGVSYEVLAKAMKTSADTTDFSVEGLARASNQYLALGSAQDKATFAQKLYGKSWIEMSRILQMGGDAILEANQAIDANLILTDAGVAKARQYEIAVDNLSDSWMGLKIAIGGDLLGPVTDRLQKVNEEITEEGGLLPMLSQSWRYLLGPIGAAVNLYDLVSNKTDDVAESTVNATRATDDWWRSEQKVVDVNEDLLASQEALWKNDADTLIGTIGNIANAAEQYASAVATLDEQLSSGMITNDEYTAGLAAAASAHEAATAQITFDMARMQLAADGWQQADTTAMLAIGEDLGIFSAQQRTTAENSIKNTQAIAEAYVGLSGVTAKQTPIVSQALEELTGLLNEGKITTQAYREKVMALYEQIKKLDGAEATAVVNLIVHGGIPNGFTPANQVEGHTYAGRAAGGPLSDVTMVGEKGYELVVRGSDGSYTVIPHEAAAWMVRAGMVPDNFMAGGGRVGYVPPSRKPKDNGPVITSIPGTADVVMGGPSNPQVPIDLDVAASNAATAQAQQDNANINAQMMAISQQGNRDVAKELQRLNDQMRSFRSELPVAVASAVQRSI